MPNLPHTYSLLDFGDHRRCEQWGPYRLVRPDPSATGIPKDARIWTSADATYDGEKGRGTWRVSSEIPAEWPVEFDDLRLAVRLAPYKHTGVFPEQLQNWRWARDVLERTRSGNPAVLNLFAYTGGATVALAKRGGFVTHVDASKPAIEWAKRNASLNELPADRVRWILDDAPAFVARERRRGRAYDAIILDPPAFGHAPNGKAWRVERDLPPLLEDCCRLLAPRPAFLILNGYARNETPEDIRALVTATLRRAAPALRFELEARELRLRSADGRELSTGVVARCSFR